MKFIHSSPILNKLEFSLGHALALHSCQAITWINVDQDPWHHMTSLTLNELNKKPAPSTYNSW